MKILRFYIFWFNGIYWSKYYHAEFVKIVLDKKETGSHRMFLIIKLFICNNASSNGSSHSYMLTFRMNKREEVQFNFAQHIKLFKCYIYI